MSNWSLTDIETLISGFKQRSLSHESWTHEAHLLVACYYLASYPVDEALIYLRSGIIGLNISMGVENSLQGGYHETLTCFWHWVIGSYLASLGPELGIEDRCNRFLKSSCAEKKLPLAFYSKDYLFDTKARAQFVEPDLQALDIKYLRFD